MVMASFLNPLSNEGQRIIKELGSLNNISIENDELLDIVTHTSRQTISRPDVVPQTIVDLALNRLKWYIERKNNKNYNSNDYAYLFNTDMVEYDTIAFIGGEFFQGQLNTKEVKDKFMELMMYYPDCLLKMVLNGLF